MKSEVSILYVFVSSGAIDVLCVERAEGSMDM